MRIAAISDVHGHWNKIDYPDADVLIISGDILRNYRDDKLSSANQLEELSSLNQKFLELKDTYKNIIVVAGNHDWCFQLQNKASRSILTNCIYLQDESVSIQGKTFYGSPWQPWFYDWAFNFPNHHENKARAKSHAIETWSKIPDSTNILITHGPPYKILDYVDGGEHVGCPWLLERINNLNNLELHVFGHIHSQHGIYGTNVNGKHKMFVNAAICTESYKPTQTVQVVELNFETPRTLLL